MGMTFFLADGIGCLLVQDTIEEIDARCGGVVYPAFGCAANIGAMLIYRVGFGIFDQAIIKTNTTTADLMKFNITRREKLQMVLKLFAGVMCLFLFGNSQEGPVTDTLGVLVFVITLTWVLCFMSQAITILHFCAETRVREKIEAERKAYETGNR